MSVIYDNGQNMVHECGQRHKAKSFPDFSDTVFLCVLQSKIQIFFLPMQEASKLIEAKQNKL